MSTMQPFRLEYGVEYEGERHFEGEMRLPTLEDVEGALEEVQDGAHQARVNRHIWARTVVRLGTIPPRAITGAAGHLRRHRYGRFVLRGGTAKKAAARTDLRLRELRKIQVAFLRAGIPWTRYAGSPAPGHRAAGGKSRPAGRRGEALRGQES
jgi:hypothetical protein